ncbi:hypothetical protein [Halobacterium noricense]|uniref:hypothetical protein n=1 Tax=Halobacterium noricense TaxID=223182 RepID=UPI001E505DC4|nr:hypothetical protein [Halobacterium noricense]UHH26643.1 hypothetical protein LT974_06845 [Halobacterium noricense]
MARYVPSKSTASDADAPSVSHLPRKVATTIVLVSLLMVQPAAAQSSAVCSADNLPSMIEGFFQLTTALGIVGLAVVWQADSLIEMFTLSPERKKGLKRHKRSAMKSAVVLVVLGPLYTVAGSMMNLPLATCVDLVPW